MSFIINKFRNIHNRLYSTNTRTGYVIKYLFIFYYKLIIDHTQLKNAV